MVFLSLEVLFYFSLFCSKIFLLVTDIQYLYRFDAKIAAAVADETRLPFVTAENKFEALVSISFLWTYFTLISVLYQYPFIFLGVLTRRVELSNTTFGLVLRK